MRRSSGSPCPTSPVPTARCCSRRRCRAWRRSPRPFSGSPACDMSATIEIRAPAEQTEGTRSQILRWLKQVGESVAENEPLIEIETEKVTVEVASPGSGVLREILRQEQEEIAPGELLGLLEPEARAASAVQVGAGAAARPAPAADGGNGGAVQGAVEAAPAASGPIATGAAPQLSPAVRRLLAERGLGAG